MEYPDTSYLCAVYRSQDNSPQAWRHRTSMTEPLPYTSLLEFEFLQSIRLQVFLHETDKSRGYGKREADRMVADWQSDQKAGLLRRVPYDAETIHAVAVRLSVQHTMAGGHRSLDVLHVATAVVLKARRFLTFDARQRKLATAAGLVVPIWR
jgi:predicted nucleic acid-binding protein